jgi:predicted flavoprotein YhiN
MAADRLSQAGVRVSLHDRMPSAGRKLLMAGRGGLNLTHSESLPAFLPRYAEAAAWLTPAISAFPPDALRAWSRGLGEPCFVGSSGRVFPASKKASPLLRAWLRRLAGQGVHLRTRQDWQGWNEDGDLVFANAALERPDATILALGGASWPRLGATGAWTKVLANKGISIAPLRPSNCGFAVDWTEHFRTRFAGQPLKSIRLDFAGRSARGEAVITEYGIEGGAVYAVSAALRDALDARAAAALNNAGAAATANNAGAAATAPAILRIDLRPDLSEAELSQKLAATRQRESLSNVLRKAVNLSPVAIGVLRESGPALPRAPAELAARIKSVPIVLQAPQPIARAISTAGGIARSELDEHFMLRRLPGVFAAGEMLDWEAPTGGYLLQAVFATGIAAAEGVLKWLARGSP